MTSADDTYGMSARDTQKWRRRRKREQLTKLKFAIEQMLEDYCRETGIGWRTENKGARVREEARQDRFAEYQREYRAQNRERRNEQSREWYDANSEKAKQTAREYRKANPVARREYQRKWRAANTEKVRGYLRKQSARNR